MKKRINSDIKSYLIRSTSYTLLLGLAVILIPLALARRNNTKTNGERVRQPEQRINKTGAASPANIIEVTNTNDSGPGSLRDALAVANDGDEITFAVTGTITLTSGELLANHSITISGPGAANLSVNGNSSNRVFYIGPDVTVIISDLTITNGNANTDFGGGIYNDQSTLTLTSCNVTSNTADFGGGIYNNQSTLTLNTCDLSGNSAIQGGAIYTDSQSANAMVAVNNSTVTDNTTSFDGGGIYNSGSFGGATLTLNYSTLSGNSAGTMGGAGGGGIYNDHVAGDAIAVVNESTLSGNSASADGGGIDNNGGTVTVSNSTLSGNSAVVAGGGIYNTWGGGNAVLTLSNSTLSGNSADAAGGSVYNDGSLQAALSWKLSTRS